MELTIPYPDSILDAAQQTKKQFEQEAKMAMAAKLFELGRISSGVAASLVGLDRVTFLLKLHEYGVPMIQGEADEFQADTINA